MSRGAYPQQEKQIIAGSSNGRTSPFEGEYLGSNPSPAVLKIMLTKTQKKAAQELDTIPDLLGLNYNEMVQSLESDAILPVLRNTKDHYIREKIVMDYALIGRYPINLNKGRNQFMGYLPTHLRL